MFCRRIWFHSWLCFVGASGLTSGWFYAASPGFIPGCVYVGVYGLIYDCVAWEHLVSLSMRSHPGCVYVETSCLTPRCVYVVASRSETSCVYAVVSGLTPGCVYKVASKFTCGCVK